MRILITDDHAVVRSGLKQILAEAFTRATFGEAASAQEAIEQVWKENWDVVVLDITMPGRNGRDVAASKCSRKSRNPNRSFPSSSLACIPRISSPCGS